MATARPAAFDIECFLMRACPGRKILSVTKGHLFFRQGDSADCVFYLKEGRTKISVVSASGKEATIRLVLAGDFFGEKAMAPAPGLRVTTATTLTECTAIRISRSEFVRLMKEDRDFSYQFSSFLLTCTIRTQADLVDQLFNRAEKRLARLLLLLAEYGAAEEDETVIAPISQEALASMIGSTRPRVNTFMNRFRKLGFIEYDNQIRVRKSLLNVFLRD
ncbi:MAG TPA: Crp/Fnr family transcriptional regulator [Terracidiphilus sp.]|jgi:CRP-like cAMP-binding protein